MTAIELLELRFPSDPRKTTVRVLLAVLLLWSFGLRFWHATPDLNSTRFWDERYGLENLEPLLKDGQLRPVHGFHPGFSYLPHGLLLKASDLLHQATGRQELAIFDRHGNYTSTTYLICRTISVLLGTLSIWLVFLIGRRLGGDRLGLLAAFLLSVVPWHLRQSILFKADITLLFTVVLTFYLSLRAIDNPSVRRFCWAGMSIGLALSAKFNAGPVALPLTVGAFLSPGSKRRALVRLVLAAAVSVAVFVALQPYILIEPEIYRRSMSSTSKFYEIHARKQGRGRLYLFWHVLESLTSARFHGPVIGWLAILGLGLITLLAFRLRRESRVALPWIMVMTYVVGYTVLYAIATPRPSPHNWLPISPFAALGGGWALLAAWLAIRSHLPQTTARAIGTVAAVAIVVVLGWQANSYVYRETVPRTSDRALELLRTTLRRPPGRLVFSEIDFQIVFQTRHRLGNLAIEKVDDLEGAATDSLNWSDAEVFATSRLENPESAPFYRDRMSRLRPKDIVAIEPQWFRAWGPPLIILLHPLQETGTWSGEMVRTQDGKRVYVGELANHVPKRHRMSIEFYLSRDVRGVRLSADDRPIQMTPFRGPTRAWRGTSFRTAPAEEIRLTIAGGHRAKRVPFTVRVWRKGKAVKRE